MMTNNVHVLRRGPAITRLLLADRNAAESAIALKAFKRFSPGLEILPVTTRLEAVGVLERLPIDAVVAGSALDDTTLPDTIRWLAQNVRGTPIVALLERLDDRQTALEAGATCVCSKPDLLVAQLRHEFASRAGSVAARRPQRIG